MNHVSVMLTAYRRQDNLKRQYEQLKAQTVKVDDDDITVWVNHGGDNREVISFLRRHKLKHIVANPNAGVWPRMWHCLAFKTPYTCVFDDDTIPGRRWFENCLDSLRTHKGLMSTHGYRLREDRSVISVHGWRGNNSPDVEQVDLAGHCWFFPTYFIKHYAFYEPRGTATCGEDYHWSYTMQQLGHGCYVPPHPLDNKELWGSIDGERGLDEEALFRRPGEAAAKAKCHEDYLAAGLKLIGMPNAVLP